jgi:hypothetical protein
MSKPIDPKELVPLALGLALGLGILTLFVLLGLSIGLTPSLQFGIPYQ